MTEPSPLIGFDSLFIWQAHRLVHENASYYNWYFSDMIVKVTFDLLILEIKFLFFKNTVKKYSNSGKHFTFFRL